MIEAAMVDVAIIGAGAAGCFAAANMDAGYCRRIVIFEKSGRALQKVKVSGGGRCNVTHALFSIPELAQRYPRGERLVRKALHHFSPADTVAWFRARGVALKKEADGRMFPVTDQSATIISCLLDSLNRKGVDIHYNKTVTGVEYGVACFTISFSDGSTATARRILVAAGGYPKAAQFGWLQALGHSIEAPVPSLFTFNLPGHSITQLMGVAVPDAQVRLAGTKIITRGPLLITHWGLSGPAVLKASAYGARALADASYEATASVSWLPGYTDESLNALLSKARIELGRQLVHNYSIPGLPKRLWTYLLQEAGTGPETRWSDLSAGSRNKLVALLLRHDFRMQGKTTYKDEFVTAGGIALNELDPQTMESRKVPGLYFAGEVINVDGITGGFNFQWAWCSAYLAAKAISSSLGAESITGP